MAEERLRAEWAQTSNLMSLIATCHADPKKGREFRASDFNPFAKQDQKALPKVGVSVLRDVFVNSRTKETKR